MLAARSDSALPRPAVHFSFFLSLAGIGKDTHRVCDEWTLAGLGASVYLMPTTLHHLSRLL
jgi:hypothetical protein